MISFFPTTLSCRKKTDGMAEQLDETDLDEIIDFCSKDLITGHTLWSFSCLYDDIQGI